MLALSSVDTPHRSISHLNQNGGKQALQHHTSSGVSFTLRQMRKSCAWHGGLM